MTDRSLDAYLAEFLFGYQWVQLNDEHYKLRPGPRHGASLLPSPTIGDGFDAAGPPDAIDWNDGYARAIPRYSSTGDGMLAVLEAMRGLGWTFSAHEWRDATVDRFTVGLSEGGVAKHSRGDADSLPLAVALAAKAALSALVDDVAGAHGLV